MTYETIITAACIFAAASILIWSFGKRAVRAEYRLELFNEILHWRDRAKTAEAQPGWQIRDHNNHLLYDSSSSPALISFEDHEAVKAERDAAVAALAKVEATIAECEAAANEHEDIAATVERNLVQILCGPGSVIHDVVRSQIATAMPVLVDQAVNATMAKLRRPSANPSMETKATQFFDAVIAKQGDRT